MTTQWDILEQAHAALTKAVAGVPDSAWGLPTPCSEWNVTQVLQHAVGDQLAYASALTGADGPAEDPFSPSGTLSDQPGSLARNAITAAATAWSTVAPGTAEVPVPVPPGKLSAEIGAGACALDAAVHAWDIAVATGQDHSLTPKLAARILEVARQIVEPLRAYGAYAPALPDQPGDDEVASLLRYLGRRPDWTR